MSDKVLCFNLNGFTLAVEPSQVEKILINKHPTKDAFTLETGVEVRSLKSYIPLPEKEEVAAENILFLKDQKDYYGFTVDRIVGYLKLKGAERIGGKKPDSSIQFFVRSEGMLIPVMDLQYVTNHENSVTGDDIEEIVSSVVEVKGDEIPDGEKEIFEDVSEEEVFKAIEEEINKNKQLVYSEDVIASEKKGVVLPLVVNIAIVVLFLAGFFLYLNTSRERQAEQGVGGRISGVEEEVIREIQRKSEQEVAEQKEKLQAARSRLQSLQQEKEFFLQNQDEILTEKENALRDEYQRRLEEAKNRIAVSGVANADAEFDLERDRLYQEYLKSREATRQEVDNVKKEYEDALLKKEGEIRREVDTYSKRIGEIEQRLVEEQTKLKETEEKFQSAVMEQQEYMTFRRQLNSVYSKALNSFARKDYDKGITQLRTIPPIIDKAKKSGIGDDTGLDVEEKLVNNILFLAEQERDRIDLNAISRQTYRAASDLERGRNLQEALSRYFTAYTIAEDDALKGRSYARAQAIMDQLYSDRTRKQSEEVEQSAGQAFDRAMQYKSERRYEEALGSLETMVTEHSGSSKSRQALDEIVDINRLISKEAEERIAFGRNEEASEIMKSAQGSYERGYYTEALDQYQDVLMRYRDSIYADEALDEIVRINEEMKEFQGKPKITMRGSQANTGVIIQLLSENTFLFSLGSEDNIKAGEVLQLYRKEGSSLVFIGSLKVTEVYPTISRGKTVYYDRQPKAGDIVSF